MTGSEMYRLAARLWPLNRSITGDGLRETLRTLSETVPGLKIHEVPSGTTVFDWTVPDEWNIREAWIDGPDGERVVDFAQHNLHLVGYSTPVDLTVELEELQNHLYSLPAKPDAIPYVTSYYSRRWGFCLRHRDREQLKPGRYRVRIDGTLKPGSLSYGECLLPGKSSEEVFLSTYVCHPSMANNELSGPCVTAALATWLSGLNDRRYSYRIIFVPETIGSLTYLSRNLDHLKQHVIAGFNITCVGDDRCYSFLPSRAGTSYSDRVALHVLRQLAPNFRRYSYLDRGSDERQYCAPGIDLPIATIMRSKYAEYPEYHTSLDDLGLITADGLEGSFTALRRAIEIIENDCRPLVTVLGEPQLGKRGLYPTLSGERPNPDIRAMTHLIAYSDGAHTLLEIADLIGIPMWELIPMYRTLHEHGLVRDGATRPGAPTGGEYPS